MKTLHLLIFALALAASLAWILLGVDRGPFDRTPAGREQAYWSTAQLLEEGRIDAEALSGSREPIYPRLLAPLTALSVPAARNVQRGVLLTLAAVILLVLLRRSGAPPVPAILGSLVPLFTAPALLGATLFTPGFLAALLVLAAALLMSGRFSWLPAVAAAFLVAVALWVSSVLAWVSLVLLTTALWRGRKRPWVFAGLTLVLALALGYGAGSHRVLPNVSGIELHQGHREAARGGHPLATDTDEARFWGRAEYIAHGSREAGRMLEGGALDRYWAGRAGVDALRHVPREILRTGRKVWMAVQPTPLIEPVTPEFTASRADGPGYGLLLWLGRLLLPLGLVGWLLARKRTPLETSLLVLSGPLACWLAYAREDLRSLTVLLLCAGAGLFLAELGRRRWAAAGWGAAAVVLLSVAPLITAGDSSRLQALDSYWLGAVYAQEERGSAALREFDRSLAYDDGSPLPRMAVADLLVQDQVIDQAIAELETVRENHPDLVAPLMSLARLYEQRERWSEAAIIHQAMIAMNPFDAGYHNNLGTAFAAGGYLTRAEESFRRALELDPGHEAAFGNLSGMQQRGFATPDTVDPQGGPDAVMALLRNQRFAQAESVLALSYAQAGADTAQLRFLEGTLYFQRGEFHRAIALFEPLNAVYGNNTMFRHNLAAAYASVGRVDEALGIWTSLSRGHPENQVFRNSLVRTERQVAAAATAAGGEQARVLWQLLVKHFPRNAAYADSLEALSP